MNQLTKVKLKTPYLILIGDEEKYRGNTIFSTAYWRRYVSTWEIKERENCFVQFKGTAEIFHKVFSPRMKKL